MEICSRCKTEMKKGAKMNSGNTMFQEWVCPHCNNKMTKAIGVNK
jgi:transposase-like protein